MAYLEAPVGGSGPRCFPAPDAQLGYWPALLQGAEADALLAALRHELAWEQHHVVIAGRRIASPRLSAWYGDPAARYRYSGLSLEPLPWTGALLELRRRLEQVTGERFNSVLANLYRSGDDSMGWHADNEPELGREPVIASVSLGAERRFLLRPRRKGIHPGLAVALGHGSLLVMAGPTQRHWRHALPRTRRPVGARLNLTFRRILA